MQRWMMKMALAAALALGAGVASAQSCVGFTDVSTTDSFCASVEWIKNRGVTAGCNPPPGATAPTYCPGDPVSRAQMALFMQRLGNALTTEVLKDHVTLFATTIPGESPTPPLILCETAGDSTVTAYPRQVLLNGSVTGLADGSAVAWRAFWLYSIDSGVTFQPIADGANNISTPHASSDANQWSGAALAFALDLPANTPIRVRVGLRRDNVAPGNTTSGNFARAICQMTVSIVNANGTSSPL